MLILTILDPVMYSVVLWSVLHLESSYQVHPPPHNLLLLLFLFVCLFTGGTGLQDPCEKGLVDASACLTAQERVNITLSAQVRPHPLHTSLMKPHPLSPLYSML